MAYKVVRMPQCSPYWVIYDAVGARWCEIPGGESAARLLCNRLNQDLAHPERLAWQPTVPFRGDPTLTV